MNKVNLVVVIIAYYPEREALLGWSKAVKQGAPVRIWDNTPGGCLFKDEFPTLEFLGTGVNLGVGPALQNLLTYLQHEGLWDKALYWDQDAQWTFESYQWALTLHSQYSAELYSYNNIILGLQSRKASESISPRLSSIRIMMTNGMVFPIQHSVDLLNSFTPYFLECVDYQICYRASLHGWALVTAYGCPGLKHDPTLPSLVWSSGSKFYRKRIYPLGRSQQFLLNLTALAFAALTRRNLPYLRIFLRNILTHIAYRTWFNALWYLRPSGRQPQNLDL